MSNYRRNYVPGGTYFFTVVTHQRRRFLTTELARTCLRQAILEERKKRPFNQLAIVLLPDHLHAIWTLPQQVVDFSLRWKQIKSTFTRLYLSSGGEEGAISLSRLRRRERAVLQRRFWEHTCADEDDLKRFLDYLHWNPVKHALAALPRDYPWSSFHKFVELGEYPIGWGGVDPCPRFDEPEWE